MPGRSLRARTPTRRYSFLSKKVAVFLAFLVSTSTLLHISRNPAVTRVVISDSSSNVLPSGFPKALSKIDTSKEYDLCAVGAGLSGTVYAERTATILKRKTLGDRHRPHIGGNCYDYVDHETGIIRNQYGSHLFHTNIERVWKYVTGNPKAPKWTSWYHQKYGVVNGVYVPIPVNIITVNRLFNLNIQTEEEMREWLSSVQVPCPEHGCRNSAEMAKSRVGEELYKLIFEQYTIKQWNKDPSDLNASVTARIPVRANFDPVTSRINIRLFRVRVIQLGLRPC